MVCSKLNHHSRTTLWILTTDQAMNIRPFKFTNADYETVVNLRNRLYPDNPSTVEIWKHNDTVRRQDPSYHFFLAENNAGELQAFVQCSLNSPQSKKLAFGLIAQADAWHNGTAAGLIGRVTAVGAKLSAEKLVCKVQENDHDRFQFLQNAEFIQVMRYPISALNVRSFKTKPFKQTLEQVQHNGIEIKQPAAGWEHAPDWQRLIYELDWQLMLDVPSHEPRTKKSLDTFLKEEIHHPNAWPESYFIAWDGADPVGLTCFVKRGGRSEVVSTALTGVTRGYRRQGIATALKIRSIKFAQQFGIKTILTNNEQHNPMFKLNKQLGFLQKPAWIDLERAL